MQAFGAPAALSQACFSHFFEKSPEAHDRFQGIPVHRTFAEVGSDGVSRCICRPTFRNRLLVFWRSRIKRPGQRRAGICSLVPRIYWKGNLASTDLSVVVCIAWRKA